MTSIAIVMNKVNQLQRHVYEEFDLDLARLDSNNLHQDGIDYVVRAIQNESETNPLPIALKLVKILNSDEIQLEEELRYPIAKACRLFSECFVWKTFTEDRIVYKETKQQLCDGLKRVISVLVDKEVATRHELECAYQAINSCNTNEKTVEVIGAHVIALVPVTKLYLAPIIQELKKDFQQKPKSWFVDVLYLSWFSYASSRNVYGYPVEEFYKYEGVSTYTKAHKIAFCMLEAEMILPRKGIETERQVVQLQGDASISRPGILAFLKLESKILQRARKLESKWKDKKIKIPLTITKKMRAADPFWRVRYRALDHLISLASTPQSEEVKTIVLKTLAERIITENDPLIKSRLKEFHLQQSKNPDWVNLVEGNNEAYGIRSVTLNNELGIITQQRSSSTTTQTPTPRKPKSKLEGASGQEEELRLSPMIDQDELRIEEEIAAEKLRLHRETRDIFFEGKLKSNSN